MGRSEGASFNSLVVSDLRRFKTVSFKSSTVYKYYFHKNIEVLYLFRREKLD